MTDQEVKALLKGDYVEVRAGGGWRMARLLRDPYVVHMPRTPAEEILAQWRVRARPLGITKTGRRHQSRAYDPWELRLPEKLDGLAANVYADYLSERGYEEAATVLRAAFPLDDGGRRPAAK